MTKDMIERVRFREGEPEMRCVSCREWWPITLDFWQPHSGLRRCVACLRRSRLRPPKAQRICGRWMDNAKTNCGRREGHAYQCRSRAAMDGHLETKRHKRRLGVLSEQRKRAA